MDIETAKKLAATSVGVSAEDAEAIITSFLEHLAACVACDGSGSVKAARQLKHQGSHGSVSIKEGEVLDCPRCVSAGIDAGWAKFECNRREHRHPGYCLADEKCGTDGHVVTVAVPIQLRAEQYELHE